MARDAAYSHPFEALPHLLLTGRYSGSTLILNEMIFRYVFSVGYATTRELIQSHRTAAHIAIMWRLGINLVHADSQGDTITVVKTKSDK